MPEVQDPPRIRSCGFSGATCRTKLLPHSVFRTREHPQSSGGARGGKARLESDHAVFRRFRAGQIYCRTPYSAQGNIHRAVGVPEVQDLPRIGFCGFLRRNAPNKASAALRISHKGTSTEQQECPRCKTRLESNYAVFQAQCAEQSFCRAPYSAQGNIHRAAGVLEGARPASNQIMQFFRRNAPNKAFAALRIPHKGTSTEQRGCSRGQGPPRIEFCGFIRRNVPDKTAPELLAPGRPRSYGNGGCNTHMTARC